MGDKVRQAVVVVHGMGEQRSLETLDGFVRSALTSRVADTHAHRTSTRPVHGVKRTMGLDSPTDERQVPSCRGDTETSARHAIGTPSVASDG